MAPRSTGAPLTAEDDETFGKDGVDQDFASVDLQKKRGVSDEGHAKLILRNQFNRPGNACHGLLVALVHQANELLYLSHRKRPSAPRFAHPLHHVYLDVDGPYYAPYRTAKIATVL